MNDWREEERLKALKWAKWAYLQLAVAWCGAVGTQVHMMVVSKHWFAVIVHAILALVVAISIAFMARVTMGSVASLKNKAPK